jgi:hypothetical protein
MDPNATLTRIRELQTALIHGSDDAHIYPYPEMTSMGVELAEHIKALDEWLSKSGFFPRDWTPF